MPPNSLDTNTIYNLDKVGGVKLTRPSIYVAACMLRAAVKTLAHVEDLAKELQALAAECLSLRAAAESTRPPGWDSDAFCIHLERASNGFLPRGAHAHSRVQVCHVIKDFQRDIMKSSLQSRLYKVISAGTPNPWPNFLNGRLHTLLGSAPHTPLHFLTDQGFASNCRKRGISSMMMVIKSWANAWATSDRLHEDLRLPCILGCCDSGAKDCLSHYLTCSVFWALLNSACRSPASRWDVSSQSKICLADPLPFDYQRLVCAFLVYHALKLGHRKEVESAIKADDFDRIHSLFLELSRFHASEHVLCQVV